MELKSINFMKRCHCPNCNCMYIIIDNEIISCPACELLANCNESRVYEENAEKELVQYQL